MKATIIITTKNRSDLLPRVLKSCQMQDYPNLEILIYNDASTDNTANIASSFAQKDKRIRVVTSTCSTGLINARNHAYREANGDLLFVLDDDAEFGASDCVQKVVHLVQGSASIGAVAIPHIDVKYDNRLWNSIPSKACNDSYFVTFNFIGTAHAIRKDVFEEIGPYPTYFDRQEEEIYLAIRLLQAGYDVAVADCSPILHYESPSRDLTKIMFFWSRNTIINVLKFYPLFPAIVYLFFSPLQFIRNAKHKNSLNNKSYVFPLLKGYFHALRHFGIELVSSNTRMTSKEFARFKKLRGKVYCKNTLS